MNNRTRILAALNYQPVDRLPVLHFGFWGETLQRWADEGHLTPEEARGWGDGNPVDAEIERLKPLMALGGFIPCPDHRLAPDAKWDNVRYYCDRMAAG